MRPPGTQADHDRMWAAMHPKVQDMHRSSGLWQEATVGETAWSPSDADEAVRNWLAQRTAGPVPLTGAGVGHLDLPFIKRFMPLLSQRLTYWPLDISPVRRMLQLAGRPELIDLERDVDSKPHRGLADAELHLDELRRYLQLFRSIPQVIG